MFMTLHIVPSIQNLPAPWILLHIELSFMQDCPLHKMDFHTGLSCKKMFLQTGMSYKQEYPANRSVLCMYTGLFCTQAKIRERIFFTKKRYIFKLNLNCTCFQLLFGVWWTFVKWKLLNFCIFVLQNFCLMKNSCLQWGTELLSKKICSVVLMTHSICTSDAICLKTFIV